ncbi:MAG: DUF3096 domain-containing protein [Aquificota bacterium]|jgi:intracellular septation protein A
MSEQNQNKTSNVFSILAVIFGIFTLVTPAFLAWIVATIAIVFGAIGLARGESKKLSYIAIVIGIIGWIFVLGTCAQIANEFQKL